MHNWELKFENGENTTRVFLDRKQQQTTARDG